MSVRMHGNHPAICICCDWIRFRTGFHGTDVTPPEGDDLRCAKEYFYSIEVGSEYTTEDAHKKLMLAQTCPDWKPRDGAIKKAKDSW